MCWLFIDKMLSVVKVLLLFQITVTINNNLMIFMNIMTKGSAKGGIYFF